MIRHLYWVGEVLYPVFCLNLGALNMYSYILSDAFGHFVIHC